MPSLYVELLRELLELKNLQISAMKLRLPPASKEANLDKLSAKMETYAQDVKKALDQFSQNMEKLITEHAEMVGRHLSKDPRSAKLELSSSFIAKELQRQINEVRSLRAELGSVLSELQKKIANAN